EMRLLPEHRAGVVLKVTVAEGQIVTTERPTSITDTGLALRDANSMLSGAPSLGLRRHAYRIWWHLYALQQEWALRIGPEISPSWALKNLRRIRLRHLQGFTDAIRRSLRIVLQRSTNPYE